MRSSAVCRLPRRRSAHPDQKTEPFTPARANHQDILTHDTQDKPHQTGQRRVHQQNHVTLCHG